MKNLYIIVFVFISQVAAGANILLTWPRDYSVFQRNTTTTGGSANVTFAGQFWDKSSTSYRIERLTATGASNGDWQPTTALPAGALHGLGTSAAAAFYFTRTVPTGWYRLYISDGSNTQTVKFGVGEVFIIAGQSNAQGSGSANNVPSISNLDCVVSNKNYLGSNLTTYQTIETPVFGVLNNSNLTIGPRGDRPWFYQQLGNQIAQKESGQVIPVCFFNVAHGGSSIDNWYDSMLRTKTMFSSNYANALVPGSTSTHQNPWAFSAFDTRFPYVDLKNAVSSYGNMFGLRCVIWHQGEAETKTLMNQNASGIYGSGVTPSGYNVTNYDTKLNAIIADTRTLLPNLPWAVSKVSLLAHTKTAGGTDYDIRNNSGNNLTTPSGTFAVSGMVTQEQANVISSTVSYASANSDSYSNAVGKRSDGTHFNSSGLTDIAVDVYSQINSIFSKAPILGANAALMGFAQDGPEMYTVMTGNYAVYVWDRNSSTDMSFNQSASNMGNPWSSGLSANWYYKGWVKDFSGRILKVVPHFNPHAISGARMAAEQSESTAYPNPASNTDDIQISFVLKKGSPVKIQILTEKGAMIDEIVETNLEAGKYTRSFSRDRLKGNQRMKFLIYKVISSEHIESKKILLVD